MALFDASGKEILSVFKGTLPAGQHRFRINRTSVQVTGLYFLKVTAGRHTLIKKVIFD
jgi:hypothetical protein